MEAQYTVVFSAWQASNDLITNIEASKRARTFLYSLSLPHWDAIGAFKEEGQATHKQEVSHIVHCSESDVPDLMRYACVVFQQDYVLVIKSSDNSASLESPSESVDLGYLTLVSKEEAQRNQAYTYFLGDYFICK